MRVEKDWYGEDAKFAPPHSCLAPGGRHICDSPNNSYSALRVGQPGGGPGGLL